jgi:TRAP-type mannitol/chloroaromatic compound transport system permease small subunit
MTALVRWIERLSDLSGFMIAWLVFPLILATCYEVFSRYVLNAPTIWAFELGYMAMGAHALIGAAYTLRCHSHIRIDILYIIFSDRHRALVDAIGYLTLFLPVVTWVSIGLWDYWLDAYRSHELSGQSAWNPVIWPFRLCFFVGLALLWLQGVAELIKALMFLAGKSGRYEAGGGVLEGE